MTNRGKLANNFRGGKIGAILERGRKLFKPFLNIYIYMVSRGECARFRENVPYVKVHRYNPKHLYPNLNGYRDNGERKCGLLAVPRTVPVSRVVTRTLRMSVLQSHSRVKHIPPPLSTDVTVTVNCNSILLDIHVPCKVLGNVRATTTLVRVYVV